MNWAILGDCRIAKIRAVLCISVTRLKIPTANRRSGVGGVVQGSNAFSPLSVCMKTENPYVETSQARILS
jgi:hypothetical protein